MCEILDTFSKNGILPVLVGITTYLLVDRLGEWKTRRNNSMLGAAIVDSLLGEIRTGLKLMKSTQEQIQQNLPPPNVLLPMASWSGMQTIPDQVLLRILAASKNISTQSFHPKAIRNVCKDYFNHMCTNYNATITDPHEGNQKLHMLLGEAPDQGRYINTAQLIIEMLEQTKGLLEQNSKRWIFPK